MNAFEEVVLISGREIRKNLRSVKGMVIVIISILGGVATSLLLMKLRAIDEAGRISPDQLREIQEAAFTKKYGDPAMGKYLADAPPVLLGMLLLTVWLVPLLIAIIGFDSISGELQHRSVRYWAVRSRRGAYYSAKTLGLWVIVCAITLLMHSLVWILAISRGGEPGVVFSWGFRFWLVTVPITAAWSGLAQLVASQFRTPIIAFLVTCASFFVLWIMDAVGEVGEIKWLTFLYPNSYDAWLLSPKFDHAAYGTLACAGFAIFSTALGSFLFSRRDV